MRTLTFSWEYPPVIEGGLARHVRKLSENLVQEGVEVHVLTRGSEHLPAREERHGVIVHRVRQAPFPRDVKAFIRWVASMNETMATTGADLDDELHFDLVHSHDWLVANAAERVARRVPRPWIATVHATEYGRHQGWVDKYPQSHIHAAERDMARRADRVITCSRYMRSHVADVFGIRPAKVTAMQNGIDPRDLGRLAVIERHSRKYQGRQNEIGNRTGGNDRSTRAHALVVEGAATLFGGQVGERLGRRRRGLGVIAQELHVATERHRGDLPARAMTVVEAGKLRPEAERES